MKDYTEQLKKHWQSDDLTFIATFKKNDDKHGYFVQLVNPSTLYRIKYPDLDDKKVDNSRVSFYYGKANKLIDGHYYSLELEHTSNPKGKNNPYSLAIRSISALNQSEVKSLLERKNENNSQSTRYSSTIYYGLFNKTSEKFACFENVMSSESGEILMDKGGSQKVFVSPGIPLKENTYYSFFIKENNGKLPNAIIDSIEELKLNPYQDYIRLRFERLNNPEANKMIANLMREIGKGMYSSKQRMIFELLQNADDAPGKDKVEFHIDIIGDYFFVMHDGAPFDKDDVEAITSAAESTKRSNNKKTGYKGIGFKSVFTDSSEVWLKSGGYQFAFLRNSPLFQDFDKFYFSGERYTKYPELLEEDKLKYRNQRLRFNGSTDIPWQVVPIWQNHLPKEFNDSNFNNFNNPVQFALKLGKNNIEEYKLAIDNITKRPQFLLFLRNTSKFRSPKNGVTVTRNDNNYVIGIEKTKVTFVNSEKEQKSDIFYYKKQIFEDIAVSDKAFSELNIGLKKQSRVNDYNEITYYFTDLEGREIETIPPKLASVTETEISFGISLVDNKISAEKEYTKGLPKYSSLFTYLPMEDIRFQLPFLVNADFVPSSDRQKIQGDNLWNKYVMIKIAEKHVLTLFSFAEEFIKDNELYSTYLSLLLRNLLPEDDTAQQIIESYNDKYLEQLNIVPVVVNDHNEVRLISDTIIDDSGLTKLFGHEIFYEIIDTQKRLPHSNLDIKYLKQYKYLEIEVVDLEMLVSHITPELCERLGEAIANKKLYEKPELLKWLNELVEYISNDFGKIPFIVHGNSLFSFETLLSEPEAWLVNKNTRDLEDILEGLGYHVINLNLSEYQNINDYLLNCRGYVNDKVLAYERIASNPNLSELNVSLKLRLINFLQNSEFMVGIGETKYYGELKLFVDEKKIARPLRQLISRKNIVEAESIQQFRIDENEYNNLTSSLKNELIQKEGVFGAFILNRELFDAWSLQFNSQNIDQYVGDLKKTHDWKDEENEFLQSQWVSIPWMYINDELRFVESDKAFWSSAFNRMSLENYEMIKAILHGPELKTLPLKQCGDLVLEFRLKTDNTLNTDWTVVKNLDTISTNILLDWMEEDGAYNDFFEQYTLISNSSDLWSFTEIEHKKIYAGTERTFKEYINSIGNLSTLFVPLDVKLCSGTRDKIGLLQGDKLLSAIIESEIYDQRLATLLPHNLTWEHLDSFVSNLPEFNLATGEEYSSNTSEHIILNHLLKNVEDMDQISDEIQTTIDSFRDKIRINQSPLSEYDLSDRIQFGKGDDKKVLNLSDVVGEFKGESDVLDNLIESFIAITEKTKLRKLIFKTRRMPFNDICSRIEAETSEYYSVHQVVFQLLHERYTGNRQWGKIHFDDYWKEHDNEEQLQTSYKSFLDIILDIDFTEITGFYFHGLEFENCVDKSYAVDSELLPQWVEEWININQSKRIAFISKLGYNGVDSPIVKLRQAMISDSFDQNTVIRYFEEVKPNYKIIWNTIKCLSCYSSDIITKNIGLIKQINDYVTLDINNIDTIVIPIISSVSNDGSKRYILQSVPTNSDLYILSDDEFAHQIFTVIKNEDETALFVDSNCGNKSSHFSTEIVQLDESVDSELLVSDSKLWEEPFYKKWEHYDHYPIYIYNGQEIPYRRTFNDTIINKFTEDLKVEDSGKYYVSQILRSNVLDHLPTTFPQDKLTELREWHYKTLQNESLLDDDSFEYKEGIDRLLQDRLGISEADQKSESGSAKTHAIYFLDEMEFDVSNINDVGAYLDNIVDPDGNNVRCIVRSAKGGLLYLDKEHWDMLEDSQTHLVVIYPGNAPRLFKERLELLEDELSECVLFRVPNKKDISEIDGVFDALESNSHLILVTSEKMKESLFSKLKQSNNSYQEQDAAIGGDDFTF